jgi:glycosyltransferase involved in cell wall biosynthesis
MFDGINESGVNKKILSQVQELNTQGIDAKLILIGGQNKNSESPYAGSPHIIWKTMTENKNNTVFTPIVHSRKVAGIIRECIQDLGPSDILYIRYPLLILFCPINFFKPFRKCKLIFEYNSILSQEYLLTCHYLYLFFELFFGNIVLLQADGGIGVTHEITEFNRKRPGSVNTPVITISNGIVVDSIPLRSLPKMERDQKIILVCVADFSPWHGIDRIINGIARYTGSRSVILHLVGGGSEIPYLRNLAVQNNLSDNIVFHEALSGPKLDKVFDESHIAVGSLGMHRNKLSESSTLKSREYCSRGIPYIIACSDPDFPDEFPYILRVPPDESFINMEQVVMFVSRVFQDPEHPKKMRQYAIEHLDYSNKVKSLKTFLEERILKSDEIKT